MSIVALGISPSHDSAVSVVRDGTHVFSVSEEQFSGRKGHIGFPFGALSYLFDRKIISASELTCVGVANDYFRPSLHNVLDFTLARDHRYFDLYNAKSDDTFEFSHKLFSPDQRPDEIRATYLDKILGLLAEHGISAPVELVDHHLAHAASVLCSSVASDPLIVTLDGEGDGLSGTVSELRDGHLTRLASVPARASIGMIYSHVTRQLGFKANRHEGKLTGLAAHGDPGMGLALLEQTMRFDQGAFVMPGDILTRLKISLVDTIRHKQAMVYSPRPKRIAARLKGLAPEDQAAAIQAFLEITVCAFVEHWLSKTGKRNLLLAGGVFANVRLNQRLSELPQVDEMFVCPAMNDSGLALGAAQVAVSRQGSSPIHRQALKHVYLGPDATEADIRASLDNLPADFQVLRPTALPETAASAIHAGLVVGWFQGALEYGPRALGHRSILANPSDASINDELNRRLSRTEFMPFAPSCLLDDADSVFEINAASRRAADFMTVTCPVRDSWRKRVCAVVHVDGTARPQFVSPATNPEFHAVISAYKSLSGLPLVVNTSFNLHESPIVGTADKAVSALAAGIIDALAIGPFWAVPKDSIARLDQATLQ